MKSGLINLDCARIDAFLEIPLPENWKRWSLTQRRNFWRNGGHGGAKPRETICAMEVWQELFERDRTTYEQKWAREINNIIKKDTRWHQSTSVDCGLPYGRQRGFIFGENTVLNPHTVKIELPADDYFVIVYRLLSYLYMCFKAGNGPSPKYLSADAFGINAGYWTNTIKSLLREGYIVGAETKDFIITQKGIESLRAHPLIKEAAKVCEICYGKDRPSLYAG